MIFTDRTIIVQKGIGSINDTIILYRGDKEVEIRFTLNEGSPFRFGSGASPNIIEKTEAAYGQLIIKRPNDLPAVFSEITPTNGGKIVFTITAEMIDEITEVGNYTFQIRLLDESRNSRATLPEVVNGIEIREPIATEDVTDTNEVGVATVGYAMTTAATAEDAFDSQGNYNKTTWGTGDRITAAKLNKIEAGIDGVNKKVTSGGASGEGMTQEQASQLSTAYQHSQATHAPSNAEANVQVDWNEADTTSDAYIKNKPTNLATTDDIPTVPTNVSEFTNDANYASETFVTNKIAEASLSGGEVDLSGYVTKETGNASQITFADGQTFQAKLDAGMLKGDKGDPGEPGASNINDTTVSANTTYSSNKIETIKENLSSQINNITVTGGGLSYTAKKAILDLFSAVAYYNKDVTNIYQTLKDALLVAIDSVTLDKTELTFTSATSQTLVATKSPVESEGVLVWESSNPSVATVDDNGIVTATGNGQCTITVTCGSVYATCNVSVSGILATYTIVNNLTNVTTSNNITNIAEGTGYIATLTPDSNYTISSVTVTMGGEDITSTAYSDGSISISSVTGDVVITATAIEDVGWVSGVAYAIEWTDGYFIDTNTGINKEDAGFSASNYLPVTNVDMLIAGNIYTNYGIFYYDENKSFLGRSESSFVVSNTNYDIPRNVRYVRVMKRLSESNAIVTPYDNEQLTENTEWKANNYYSLNWREDVGLSSSTGLETTSAGSAVSEFAFCYGANTLQFSSGSRTFIYFYNSNKEFLEYKIRQNATEPITIPETAQYFRITKGTTTINYWVQLA